MVKTGNRIIRKKVLIKYQDFNDKKYTDLDRDFARITQQSYQPENLRLGLMKIGNSRLLLYPKLSSPIFAHYENEDNIVVAFHGVNDKETAIAGIEIFFLDTKNKIFQESCKKYTKVIKTPKNLFLVGHSLGSTMLQHCYYNLKKHKQIISFAGFTNIENIVKFTGNKHIRKIIYSNDLISNGILNIKNKKNVISIVPKLLSKEWIEGGHFIKFFIKPIDKINKGIKN